MFCVSTCEFNFDWAPRRTALPWLCCRSSNDTQGHGLEALMLWCKFGCLNGSLDWLWQSLKDEKNDRLGNHGFQDVSTWFQPSFLNIFFLRQWYGPLASNWMINQAVTNHVSVVENHFLRQGVCVLHSGKESLSVRS